MFMTLKGRCAVPHASDEDYECVINTDYITSIKTITWTKSEPRYPSEQKICYCIHLTGGEFVRVNEHDYNTVLEYIKKDGKLL